MGECAKTRKILCETVKNEAIDLATNTISQNQINKRQQMLPSSEICYWCSSPVHVIQVSTKIRSQNRWAFDKEDPIKHCSTVHHMILLLFNRHTGLQSNNEQHCCSHLIEHMFYNGPSHEHLLDVNKFHNFIRCPIDCAQVKVIDYCIGYDTLTNSNDGENVHPILKSHVPICGMILSVSQPQILLCILPIVES